ncbi:hypothetical protein H9P43_008710 [Blastocladiella emersonii ATCC 22665]|nr:hypothetical protein H9P43_008710 [Blastocladiella emersonii ATCC 22665]
MFVEFYMSKKDVYFFYGVPRTGRKGQYVATALRETRFRSGASRYMVSLAPNVDAALIAALVSIVDRTSCSIELFQSFA